MSKKRDDNEIQGSSAPQKIGTGIIALMTLIGFSLIIYTGVRVFLYSPPNEDTVLGENPIVLAPEPEDEVEEEPELELPVDEDPLDEAEPDEEPILDEEPDDEEPEEVVAPDPEPEVPSAPTSFRGRTTATTLLLRAEPSVDAQVLDMLAIHTEIDVLDSQYENGFAHISWVNGNGTTITGFVTADWIEPLED